MIDYWSNDSHLPELLGRHRRRGVPDRNGERRRRAPAKHPGQLRIRRHLVLCRQPRNHGAVERPPNAHQRPLRRSQRAEPASGLRRRLHGAQAPVVHRLRGQGTLGPGQESPRDLRRRLVLGDALRGEEDARHGEEVRGRHVDHKSITRGKRHGVGTVGIEGEGRPQGELPGTPRVRG